jgi:NADH:ubiquinone oxidoreductase subunit E
MGFVMEKVKVELCMGSSCFARGNSQALANLESYISENHLEDRVELIGHLCLGSCSSGPNLKIDDVSFSGVRSECVVDLLIDALNKPEKS